MRKVCEFAGTDRSATVFYDFDFEEFVVKFYEFGTYSIASDYFTHDRVYAIETAAKMVEAV